MVEIIPAILATTEETYLDDLKKLTDLPSLEDGWLHIDFADNIFVPNQTVTTEVVEKYPTNLKKEAHLMVENPLEWVDSLIECGFERIILHIESSQVAECIEKIKASGIQAGLAINLETSLEKLIPFFSTIDLVLVMSIEPGFQGQPFREESLDRIEELKGLRDKGGFAFRISVDGHVNDQNARQLVDQGVDSLVIGSFLLKGDIDENIEKIWEKVNS